MSIFSIYLQIKYIPKWKRKYKEYYDFFKYKYKFLKIIYGL